MNFKIERVKEPVWIPHGLWTKFLESHSMVSGNSKFLLDNWDLKYVNVRVDMRTEQCIITLDRLEKGLFKQFLNIKVEE